MGLMDKAKAAAEQAAGKAKAGAEQAAARAREEMHELQTKRDLNQTYSDLGKKVCELAARGELSHPEIAALVERAGTLKAELEAAATEAAAPAAAAPEATPAAGDSTFWKPNE